MRRALALAVLLAASAGCENTTSDVERGINPPAAGLTFTGAITTGLLAAEAAFVVDTDDLEGLDCPGASIEDDDLRAEYGGCVPDSGLTGEVLSGVINLTVPAGTGLFDGTISALGPGDSGATGLVTGSASRAGDLLSADVELSEVAWSELRGESPIADAFYDIDGDASSVTITVDGGVWDRGQARNYTFWLDAVVVPRGELDTCVIPEAGQFRVQRDNHEATIDFSPEAAAEGTVLVHITGDDEPASLRPCG